MLIGLCGGKQILKYAALILTIPGICAGKASAATFLVEEHGFKRIHLSRDSTDPVDAGSSDAPYTFSHVDSLLEFVTLRWREHWVTTDIWDVSVVDALMRRPFFLLVSIDAPVSIRWKRFTDRCGANKLTSPSLEEFVLRDDAHLYAPGTGLAALFQRAPLKLQHTATP